MGHNDVCLRYYAEDGLREVLFSVHFHVGNDTQQNFLNKVFVKFKDSKETLYFKTSKSIEILKLTNLDIIRADIRNIKLDSAKLNQCSINLC